MQRIKKLLRLRWVQVTIVALLMLMVTDFWFVNFTEPTEIGISRNLISGELYAQTRGGWYVTPPWVLVFTIDTRPIRVSVDSAGRGYNAQLVQFVPEEWRSFIETEGFHYWWFANRVSFNLGYRDEHRGMKDILRGYAYGTKQYPFMRVLQKYEEE